MTEIFGKSEGDYMLTTSDGLRVSEGPGAAAQTNTNFSSESLKNGVENED